MVQIPREFVSRVSSGVSIAHFERERERERAALSVVQSHWHRVLANLGSVAAMADRYPIPNAVRDHSESNGISRGMQPQYLQPSLSEGVVASSNTALSIQGNHQVKSDRPMPSGSFQNYPQPFPQPVAQDSRPPASFPSAHPQPSPRDQPHQIPSGASEPHIRAGYPAMSSMSQKVANAPASTNAPQNLVESRSTADHLSQCQSQSQALYSQSRRLPVRPVAPEVAGITSGMARTSLSTNQQLVNQVPPQLQHQMAFPNAMQVSNQPSAVLPPGVQSVNPSDPAALVRPDFSAAAVTARVSGGDHGPSTISSHIPPSSFSPVQQTQSPQGLSSPEAAACPPGAFVPASGSNIRLTVSAFPSSIALSKKYGLPLGAVIQPLADPGQGDTIPVVNFGTTGIVRCRRCRTYINFSCRFTDGGRRWTCSMCRFPNDCPADYFCPLDSAGCRTDAANRPELCRGSIEFVAPAEYMIRPPMPPVYLFILEFTPAAILSGALTAMVTGIKAGLDTMSSEGRTRVGLITYDNAVQFYTLPPGDDAEPSIAVVVDVDEMFIPAPDNILVPLSESRPAFEKALDLILSSSKSRMAQLAVTKVASSSTCLGAALQGGQKVMEHCGGKMLMLVASRPSVGPGALRERGDGVALGTDRERAILRPDSTFYRQLAVECSRYQMSCDLFICPPPPGVYMDVATLSQLAKYTGGEIFRAAGFEAYKDHSRLARSVYRSLTRIMGFEAVMRIRASKGIRCSHFHGRFFIRSTDLLALPNVDSDKAYAVQFSFDDSVVSTGPFCMQVALLYTTCSGERRIRVHTVCAPMTNSVSDLIGLTDSPTVANILLRVAAESVRDRLLNELKKNLTDKMVTALATCRTTCLHQSQSPSDPNSAGQLLLPDALNLLPLLMHGLLKSPLLSMDSSGAFLYKVDDKAAVIQAVDVMNVAVSSAMLYPNMMRVLPPPKSDDWDPQRHIIPPALPASSSSLQSDTGVLIDDGQSLILWIGSNMQAPFAADLMPSGTASARSAVDPRQIAYLLMEQEEVKGSAAVVRRIVRAILSSRSSGTPFYVAFAGGPLQARVEALCIEDRSAVAVGYREFITEISRQVMLVSGRK